MWQPFTERARRVILLGQEEAGQMNSAHVGTEHLLLGLIRENEGVAAQVLQKLGVSLQVVEKPKDWSLASYTRFSAAGNVFDSFRRRNEQALLLRRGEFRSSDDVMEAVLSETNRQIARLYGVRFEREALPV